MDARAADEVSPRRLRARTARLQRGLGQSVELRRLNGRRRISRPSLPRRAFLVRGEVCVRIAPSDDTVSACFGVLKCVK